VGDRRKLAAWSDNPVLVRVILTAALMIGTDEAHGQVAVAGFGMRSCGTWTAVRHDGTALGHEQWILGFLSAVGYTNFLRDQMNPLEGTDADGVWAWIDNYCQAHPLDRIINAADAFSRAHPR
jgi:hypothetical protein